MKMFRAGHRRGHAARMEDERNRSPLLDAPHSQPGLRAGRPATERR